jgi:dihydrolipoamide dehydrogenase
LQKEKAKYWRFKVKLFDAVILGAGPGGYVAAIRLAQLGKKVCVVEKDQVGGVCLNVGCIPTKALLEVTSIIEKVETFKGKGIWVDGFRFEPKRMREWKKSVVTRLVKGVEYLFKQNGVELLRGYGELLNERQVKVNGEVIEADSIILATGSSPKTIPGFDFDGVKVLDSTSALEVSEIPKHLLIVGAGVIGVEMATIFRRLGSEVTVVEILPQILTGFDTETVSVLKRNLERKGIKFHLNSKLIKEDGKLFVIKGEGKISIEPDKILIAAGRKPNTEAFVNAGVELDERGFVKVDEDFSTNLKSVYAIGDIIPGPQLAHKASREGIMVAEIITSGKPSHRAKFIPSVVYGDPEIVKVGYTEEELKEKGINYKVGKFPFQANGRALTQENVQGFVKILGDERDNVLGFHIVGPHASEFAGIGALVLENGLKVEDIAKVIFPHPTLSEAIMECAENYYKKAIHIVNR